MSSTAQQEPPARGFSRMLWGLSLLGLLLAPLAPAVSGWGESAIESPWIQNSKVTPDDADEPGWHGWPAHTFVSFGASVALDGDTMVVGTAHQPDAALGGWVYVFERNQAGGWDQVAKLTPEESDRQGFGSSVDVDEDAGVLAVGDPGFDKPGSDNAGRHDGAAYVFERSQTGAWDQTARFVGPDDRSDEYGANFGYSVAVEGERIVVAAPMEDLPGKTMAGAIYVFEKDDGDDWTRESRLTAETPRYKAFFGGMKTGVALAADRILVGAPGEGTAMEEDPHPGAAYLLAFREGSWEQIHRFSAPDPGGRDAGNEVFGFSVAMDADRIVVGDIGWLSILDAVGPTSNTGKVYVFEPVEGGWQRTADLQPPEATPGDWFGKAFDIEGDVIAVADHHKPMTQRNGVVYMFEHTDLGWQATNRLVSNETSHGDHFGWSISMDGGLMAVGAPFDDNRADGSPPPVNDMSSTTPIAPYRGGDAGSVYVFASPSDSGQPGLEDV